MRRRGPCRPRSTRSSPRFGGRFRTRVGLLARRRRLRHRPRRRHPVVRDNDADLVPKPGRSTPRGWTFVSFGQFLVRNTPAMHELLAAVETTDLDVVRELVGPRAVRHLHEHRPGCARLQPRSGTRRGPVAGAASTGSRSTAVRTTTSAAWTSTSCATSSCPGALEAGPRARVHRAHEDDDRARRRVAAPAVLGVHLRLGPPRAARPTLERRPVVTRPVWSSPQALRGLHITPWSGPAKWAAPAARSHCVRGTGGLA